MPSHPPAGLRSSAALGTRLRSPYALVCVVFVLTRLVLLLLTVHEDWFHLPSVTYDVRNVYQGWYQDWLSHGRFPNHDRTWQYPPAAALVLLAPGLLPFSYATSFYLISFAFDVLAFAILLRACRRVREPSTAGARWWRSGEQPWAAWVWTLGVAVGGPIAYGRYDLIVTAVTLCGWLLLTRSAPGEPVPGRRSVAGGALVAAGAMLKLWPGLLLLALGPARRARKAWVSAGLTIVAILLAFLLTMPNALSFVSQQGGRGLEIESLFALPFHIAIHHGWDGGIALNYGALEFLGSGVHLVSLLALASSFAAMVWLLLWRARVRTWRRSTTADAALVAVGLFVITSRVISPQYMVWLVGLGAVAALQFGPRGDSRMQIPVVLVLIATALSSVEFPFWFDQLMQAQRGAVLLLTLRNLLLLAAVFIGATQLWRSTRASTGPGHPDADRRPVDPGAIRFAALAIAASIAVAAHYYHGNPHQFFDLEIYRSAMRWWAQGNPLYDFSQPDYVQGHLGFSYPPFAALIMRPLAALSAGASIAAYTVIGVGLMAASLWWLIKPLAGRRGWPRWFTFGMAAVLASGLEPIRETYAFGQINPLIWALVLLDLLVLGPRRSRAFGIGIGLATAVKLTPGLFVLYLLLSRRGRAAGVAIGTFLAANLVVFVVAPGATWTYFTDKMWQTETVGRVDYVPNQSLLGALARVAHPGEPNKLVWLVLAVAVLVLGMWRARTAALCGDELAGLTITGFCSALLSPVTWTHHLGWFVPALVLLAEMIAAPGPVGRRARITAAAVICYLTVTYSVVLACQAGHFSGSIGQVLAQNWDMWLSLAFVEFLPIRGRPRAMDATTPPGQTGSRARSHAMSAP